MYYPLTYISNPLPQTEISGLNAEMVCCNEFLILAIPTSYSHDTFALTTNRNLVNARKSRKAYHHSSSTYAFFHQDRLMPSQYHLLLSFTLAYTYIGSPHKLCIPSKNQHYYLTSYYPGALQEIGRRINKRSA